MNTKVENPQIYNNIYQVNTIELFDSEGKSVVFEHLETIETDGAKYVLLTPFSKIPKEGSSFECDVYVLLVALTDDNEEVLKMVKCENTKKMVYGKFKRQCEHYSEFTDWMMPENYTSANRSIRTLLAAAKADMGQLYKWNAQHGFETSIVGRVKRIRTPLSNIAEYEIDICFCS